MDPILIVLALVAIAIMYASLDLTPTASQVQPGSGTLGSAEAGEAITAGQDIYVKKSDKKAYKAKSNVDAATAAARGVAVCDAAQGQRVTWQETGPITMGAAAGVVQGEAYFVSDTAGGICPEADLGSGEFVTYLGTGNDSDGIELGIHVSGIQVP